MLKFVGSIKKKYQKRLINRQAQWPPYYGGKFVTLELLEEEWGKGYSADCQRGVIDSDTKRTPIPYCELFTVKKAEKNVKTVLIEGDAGVGKTTLCVSVAEDWANGFLFQHFEVVLLLPLREKRIAEADSLSELLGLLHPSQKVISSVVENLEDNEGDNVLIIADGWDELDEAKCREGSFLHSLLFGKQLPFTSIILTSRPHASRQLHSSPLIDRLVEIVGFDNDQIVEYIHSEFSNNPEKASRLLLQFDSNPLIKSICCIPLNCVIICHLWRTLEESLPATLTELYTKIILNIVLRNIQKISPEFNSIDNFDSIPGELKKFWWYLCEFAFEALKQSKIVFSQQELIQCFPHSSLLDKRMFYFGLLQSSESILEKGRAVSFHFPHLTFQEYLAALHLATQPSEVQIEVCRMYTWNSSFTIMWRFYFGIGSKCESISSQINSIPDNAVDAFLPLTSPLQLCHLSFEGNSNTVNSKIAQKIDGNFHLYPHTQHDCAAILHVISNTQKCDNMKIIFWNCSLSERYIAELANVICHQTELQIKHLVLHGCKVTNTAVVHLFDRTGRALKSLARLDLDCNSVEVTGLHSVFSSISMSSSKHLQRLILSHNPLSVSGLLSLEHALCEDTLPNLEVLDVSGSLTDDADINAALITILAEALSTHCLKMKELYLSENNLQKPGGPALGKMMYELCSANHNFSIFSSDAFIDDDSVFALCQYIQATVVFPCYLGKLVLCRNCLHPAAVSHLVDVISSGRLLVNRLRLDVNPIGLKGALFIGRLLSCDSHLKELSISCCHIFAHADGRVLDSDTIALSVDIEKQLSSLSPNTTLTNLCLDHNYCFSDESVYILAGLIHTCTNLVDLSTNSCKITSDYLIHLLHNLPVMSCLERWWLCNNEIDDSGAHSLVHHLQLFPKLECIDISNNCVGQELREKLNKEVYIQRRKRVRKLLEVRFSTFDEEEYQTQWEVIVAYLYHLAEPSTITLKVVEDPASSSLTVQQPVGDGSLSINDLGAIQEAIWEARAHWYNIGLHLGFHPGTLDAINLDHKSCGMCFTKMLKDWLNGMIELSPPTKNALAEALKSPTVGLSNMAFKL